MQTNKPKPTDEKLYQQVKADIYVKIPKHSAYRSGLIVKKYKEKFAKKYPGKQPYIGKKPSRKSGGLRRWFAEDWRNQRGEIGYKKSSDVYRPTKRISKKTPVTFSELSRQRINRARKEKSKRGRVRRF